jgi:hypothetical protein
VEKNAEVACGTGCEAMDYQRFVLDKLAKLPGIATYRSTLIMRVVKHTTVLPV